MPGKHLCAQHSACPTSVRHPQSRFRFIPVIVSMTSSSARTSARHSLPPLFSRIAALAPVLALASVLSAADTARRGATETALDRYVAKADPSFAWKKVAEVRDEAATGYSLDMVSQQWLSPGEVNRTEWRHWVTIIDRKSVV